MINPITLQIMMEMMKASAVTQAAFNMYHDNTSEPDDEYTEPTYDFDFIDAEFKEE